MFETLVKIAKDKTGEPDLLIQLIAELRPSHDKNSKYASERLADMVDVLEKDEFLLIGLRAYLHKLLRERKFSTLIADVGIISEDGFLSEISGRLYHKILPIQPPEKSMEYVITNVFHHSKDADWFKNIPDELLDKLLELLKIIPVTELTSNHFSITQVLFSIELLAMRICGKAMDHSLLKMVPEFENLESPFIALQKETAVLLSSLTEDVIHLNKENIDVRQIFVLLRQCHDYLEKALKNKDRYGISFQTTIKIVRLQQQLSRMQMILEFLMPDPDGKGLRHGPLVRFIKRILEFNSQKNNVRFFWKNTSRLMAYQITQHSGKTGEHYITNSRKEYFKMLYSASGGGVVVGMLCLFKMLYSYADVSPLGHAILYSMNYALGFMAIYLMHFTLATKQPAMTAATLAASLESKNKAKVNYAVFSSLFVRLFRSQFIAFVGNMLFAFPTAIAMIYIWQWITGNQEVIQPHIPEKLLKDTHFLKSPALFHASIAGFFLFLSGLISGYFVNRNIHEKISYRIRKHPILRRFFPSAILDKVARWYDQKIGGLSGNLWLGIFLGSIGIVGAFTGLPLDIRHITFSTGNVGIALVGNGFSSGITEMIMVFITVILIGFLNFMVSFSLSLSLALRSRGFSFKELIPIGAAIYLRFKQDKLSFFFPPKDALIGIEERSRADASTPGKKE